MALRTYPLTTMQHAESGHFFAVCDALPAFIAHGQTMEELSANSIGIIRRILERKGQSVLSVEISPQPPEVPEEIKVLHLTAVAMLAPAA